MDFSSSKFLMVSGLYIAVFAFLQTAMVVWIARARIGERVSLGTSDSVILERRTRVYGNFIEVVPMACLLMVVSELGGAPLWGIHLMGVLMIVSRFLHACGILSKKGYGRSRMVGMMLSGAVFVIGAVFCISLALDKIV